VRRLLERVFIAPDLRRPRQHGRNTAHCDFVTASGEILSRTGIYSGAPEWKMAKPKLGSAAQKIRSKNCRRPCGDPGASQRSSRVKGALQSEQTALQASCSKRNGIATQEVPVATPQGEFKRCKIRGARCMRKSRCFLRSDASFCQEQEGSTNATLSSCKSTSLKNAKDSCRSLCGIQRRLDACASNAIKPRPDLNETKIAMATVRAALLELPAAGTSVAASLAGSDELLQQRRSEVHVRDEARASKRDCRIPKHIVRLHTIASR